MMKTRIKMITNIEKKKFIEGIPDLTNRIFEDESESILLAKVLMTFLDKTINKDLQNWEMNWSNDEEEMKENFSKCLYIMATSNLD